MVKALCTNRPWIGCEPWSRKTMAVEALCAIRSWTGCEPHMFIALLVFMIEFEVVLPSLYWYTYEHDDFIWIWLIMWFLNIMLMTWIWTLYIFLKRIFGNELCSPTMFWNTHAFNWDLSNIWYILSKWFWCYYLECITLRGSPKNSPPLSQFVLQ